MNPKPEHIAVGVVVFLIGCVIQLCRRKVREDYGAMRDEMNVGQMFLGLFVILPILLAIAAGALGLLP